MTIIHERIGYRGIWREKEVILSEIKKTTKYAEVLRYCARVLKKNKTISDQVVIVKFTTGFSITQTRFGQQSAMNVFTIPQLQEIYNGFGWYKEGKIELKSLTFASGDGELLCSQVNDSSTDDFESNIDEFDFDASVKEFNTEEMDEISIGRNITMKKKEVLGLAKHKVNSSEEEKGNSDLPEFGQQFKTILKVLTTLVSAKFFDSCDIIWYSYSGCRRLIVRYVLKLMYLMKKYNQHFGSRGRKKKRDKWTIVIDPASIIGTYGCVEVPCRWL